MESEIDVTLEDLATAREIPPGFPRSLVSCDFCSGTEIADIADIFSSRYSPASLRKMYRLETHEVICEKCRQLVTK